MNRLFSYLSIIVFFFALRSDPAAAQARKYSNEFLNIGVDARSLGMSGATIASVSDATAGYWNPAGLTAIRNRYDFALMHAEYFASIAKYDYVAAAMPIDAVSTAGISIIRFGVDDIMDTSELIDQDGNVDYDRINLFSAADYALLFSYARKSKIEGLSYGANVKVIYRNIGDFADAFGFGLDVGAQYQWKRWRFGLMARDITSTFNAWSFDTEKFEDVFLATGNELPEDALEITTPQLLLGVARSFDFNSKFSLLVEGNSQFSFAGERNTLISSKAINIDPSLGFEFGYKGFVFLRGGVGNFQRETDFRGKESLNFQPNIGIGFRYKNIAVDYALTDIADQSTALYSNIFSLKFNFARKTASP